MEKTEEKNLIAAAQKGDQAAFQALYKRHVNHVWAVVTRLLGPRRQEVEDVVQDVFLQAYRSLRQFQGQASFGTWLHRLAINTAISHLRRAKLSKVIPFEGAHHASPSSPPEAQLDARATLRRVHRYLLGLSPEQRAVFVLYELEGMKLREISETLNVPLNTAAARLRRGRQHILEQLALEDDAQALQKRTQGGLS